MRISDWSSDVCSSDLHVEADVRAADPLGRRALEEIGVAFGPGEFSGAEEERVLLVDDVDQRQARQARHIGVVHENIIARSEEHTSELQSLMRISYAVFCLKKKKTPETQSTNNTN